MNRRLNVKVEFKVLIPSLEIGRTQFKLLNEFYTLKSINELLYTAINKGLL